MALVPIEIYASGVSNAIRSSVDTLPPVMAVAAPKESDGDPSSRRGLPMTTLIHRITQKNSLHDKFFKREESPTKQKVALRYSHSNASPSESRADRVSTASSNLPSLYGDSERNGSAYHWPSARPDKQRSHSEAKSDLSGFSFGKGSLPLLDNAAVKLESDRKLSPSKPMLSKHESFDILSREGKIPFVSSLVDLLGQPLVDLKTDKDLGYHSRESSASPVMDWPKKIKSTSIDIPFRLKLALNDSLDHQDGPRSQSVDLISERIVGSGQTSQNNPILYIDPFTRNISQQQDIGQIKADVRKGKVTKEIPRQQSIGINPIKSKPQLQKTFVKYDAPIKPSFRFRPEPTPSKDPPSTQSKFGTPTLVDASHKRISGLTEREKNEIQSVKAIKSCLTAKNFATDNSKAANVESSVKSATCDTKKGRHVFRVKSRLKDMPRYSASCPQISVSISKSCQVSKRAVKPINRRCDSSIKIGSYVSKSVGYKTSNMPKGKYFKTDSRLSKALDGSMNSPRAFDGISLAMSAKHSELYSDMLDMNRIVKGKTTGRKKRVDDQPRMFKMKIGQQNVIVVDHNRTANDSQSYGQHRLRHREADRECSPLSDSQWVPPNTPHYEEIYKAFADSSEAENSTEQRGNDWNVRHLDAAEDAYPDVLANRSNPDDDEEKEEAEAEIQDLENSEAESNKETIHVHVPTMLPSTPDT
ncbi:hypothetical protein CAPTEDRAFT_208234 [Capitella teleta]|uniref:Uncharacterized protein n=1 Tax=Capitella teleta TaxID=283909 RepID=R7TR56_CAPTE|nr:hypothetical protein CAPTEDRAFT_208234 [Capitella teleta]|eukprot:ELT96139.1 hypothetical protein CAPTEDRAFT_208234 [Capitella teleta]